MKRQRVCIRIYICVCIYCIYARQLHMWVCRCLDVCMCVLNFLHICTPSLHVYTYIFTCMVAEFTCVSVYVYIYAHRICKWCMCLHVDKLSLHVFVYMSTYIHTETTYMWVYIYIYVHQVYRWVYAEFTCMCACIDIIHVRQIHMCVHIFTHIYTCV